MVPLALAQTPKRQRQNGGGTKRSPSSPLSSLGHFLDADRQVIGKAPDLASRGQGDALGQGQGRLPLQCQPRQAGAVWYLAPTWVNRCRVAGLPVWSNVRR